MNIFELDDGTILSLRSIVSIGPIKNEYTTSLGKNDTIIRTPNGYYFTLVTINSYHVIKRNSEKDLETIRNNLLRSLI